MKTNSEVIASLNMVIARLEGEPRTEKEWRAIAETLVKCSNYATKTARMYKHIESFKKP